MVEVTPAPAWDSCVDNPSVGNFNLGKKSGQANFEEKTKSFNEENRLTATDKDAQVIFLFLENKAQSLGKFVT